jgi:citrate synthase
MNDPAQTVTTALSHVDGAAGAVSICGYDLKELVERAGCEEVMFLLWRGYLPKANELRRLKADLGEARRLPQPLTELLATFPRDTHPMTVLRAAVCALGVFDLDAEGETDQDNLAKARHIVAQLPVVATTWLRMREDKPAVEASAKALQSSAFLHMLRGEIPDPTEVAQFDRILVILADHGVDTPAAAARMVASTRGDMYAAIGAGLGALQGGLHGGAIKSVMETIQRIGTRKKVQSHLERMLQKKLRLPGFGHAVHKHHDPRAGLMKPIAAALGAAAKETLWYEIASDLEDAVALAVPGLTPNVDFYLAPALYSLGIPPDAFSAVFACARASGLTAHVLEQRGQPAWPLCSAWAGSPPRVWKPLAER